MSGNELEELPNSITDLDYLGILDLSNNSLSSIPESLGSMGFQFLNLKNNHLKTIPLSFLNIEVDELVLQGNPLEKTPDLKTRFIIESLKRRVKIDVDLPEFKLEFECEESLINRIDNLIEEYSSLYGLSSEEFLEMESWQDKISYKLIKIGYTNIER